ncbi:MAG TPA: cytoplasmic protein [Polyangia bacterium]|jgi:quercetin dioxygenase-like cupin family protein|nr:cytoplasmic protein [Polyangia bacterium]
MRPPTVIVACCLLGAGCATTSAGPPPDATKLSTETIAVAPSSPSPTRAAPDPIVTDPDKYHVVLENDCVRVLRYHDEPGAVTKEHHHRSFVMVALAPFERELVFPDGRHQRRSFRQGEAAWVPAQTHAGHNIGAEPTDGLLVEVKACQPSP